MSRQEILTCLTDANRAVALRFPGDDTAHQPIHSYYESAALFHRGRITEITQEALTHQARYLSSPAALSDGFELSQEIAEKVIAKLLPKMQVSPIEDYRIDFEDGFGVHPDEYEDTIAIQCAIELAEAMSSGAIPPFIGIRTKPFNDISVSRSTKTIDLFIKTLIDRSQGKLPNNFVITLPKVSSPAQVEALVAWLDLLEEECALPTGVLMIELMIETTQSFFDATGRAMIPQLLSAAKDRCRGVHFGTYDYTASCGLTAAEQRNDHPVCDFARQLMKIGCAGTGVWLSDGSNNILPMGNEDAVRRSHRISFSQVSNSLMMGYYQGWDLHPGQVSVRYVAMMAFYIRHIDDSLIRLKALLDSAAEATLTGAVFDDIATGQGLLNTVKRALKAGIISQTDLIGAGISPESVAHSKFSALLGHVAIT